MTFTASDVLLKAASRIEEEGMWCQGRFFADRPAESEQGAWAFIADAGPEHRTSECAIGALMSATVQLGLTFADYWQAENRLANLVMDEYGKWISEWNDCPGQTPDVVADAMRRAAL